MTISTSSTTLPDIPLTCLNTAEFKNTLNAFEGKNTVIGESSQVSRVAILLLSASYSSFFATNTYTY